jgi:hypothetical protein
MKRKKAKDEPIFESYPEFCRLTRLLNADQLAYLRECMGDEQINQLRRSRDESGFWQLELANEFDNFLVQVESLTNFNPIKIRLQLLEGRRIRLPSPVWDEIVSRMEDVDSLYVAMLTDGVVCRRDSRSSDFVILTLGGKAT